MTRAGSLVWGVARFASRRSWRGEWGGGKGTRTKPQTSEPAGRLYTCEIKFISRSYTSERLATSDPRLQNDNQKRNKITCVTLVPVPTRLQQKYNRGCVRAAISVSYRVCESNQWESRIYRYGLVEIEITKSRRRYSRLYFDMFENNKGQLFKRSLI